MLDKISWTDKYKGSNINKISQAYKFKPNKIKLQKI